MCSAETQLKTGQCQTISERTWPSAVLRPRTFHGTRGASESPRTPSPPPARHPDPHRQGGKSVEHEGGGVCHIAPRHHTRTRFAPGTPSQTASVPGWGGPSAWACIYVGFIHRRKARGREGRRSRRSVVIAGVLQPCIIRSRVCVGGVTTAAQHRENTAKSGGGRRRRNSRGVEWESGSVKVICEQPKSKS